MRQIDQTLVNWIYTTVNKSVFDIVYRRRTSAFTLWGDVEGLFLDNDLHRAVYLEAELRSAVQGDSTIDEYCTSLKRIADKLRDIGQPVSESSQVLNLLRGLNPKYCHVKPVITSKRPPHTFLSARSFLALEELQMAHDDKLEAGHALLAAHDGHGTPGQSSSSPGRSGSGSRQKNKSKPRNKKSSGSGGYSGNPQQQQPPRPASPAPSWTAGYNPWTGLVQAWPVPFRAPAAGVLGPRPPFPQQ